MKRIFAILSLLIALSIPLLVQAQTVHSGEITVGSNMIYLQDIRSTKKWGGFIGARNYMFFNQEPSGFYLSIGALFSVKGIVSRDNYYNPLVLELPFHAGYQLPISENFALFADAGPYIGIGLWGEHKGENLYSEGGFKRFEAGVGARLGIEVRNHSRFALGYDFGLTDMLQEADSKSRNLTLSYSYRF